MTTSDRRNIRTLQVAHRLSAKGYGTAQRITDALARITTELDVLDGYGSGGEPGDGDSTQPEAFMLRRYHWTSTREDLRDAILGLEIATQHLDRVCSTVLEPERQMVQLCDGRTFEGAEEPWIPYSRDPDNGWRDPLCRNAANPTGLCNACQIRERRWRLAHDLEPRQGTLVA